MGTTSHAMREALFERARNLGICDPITGCFPEDERALSGLLCLYAQLGRIHWHNVSLYGVESSLSLKGKADELITESGVFLSEYRLRHSNESEQRVWGDMAADLMYVNSDLTSVVIFENKIGARVSCDPLANQLACQLDYLMSLRSGSIRQTSLVLISGRNLLQKGWYSPEFAGALQHNERCNKVAGYFATWEDIFDATVR